MSVQIQSKLGSKARHYLWQIVRYKPVLFWGLVICYVVQYCLSMVPVLIARQIIDGLNGAKQAGLSFEMFMVVWVVSEIARAGLFSTIVTAELIYFHRFWSLIRANLMERLLSLPGARALPYSVGEALSRFRDDVEVVQDFMSALYNAVAMGAFALIAFGVMLTINVRMTVVVFLPMVLITLLVNQARERIVAYRTASQSATSRITETLGEMFGAVAGIQAAQAEERMIGRLQGFNRTRQKAALRDSLLTEILLSIIRNITNFGTGLMLLMGAESMRLGQFTVGDFTLFVFYLGWVTEFTAFFGRLLSVYRQVGVSFERLEVLMQGDPAPLVKHRPIYFRKALPALPTPIALGEPLQALEVKGLSYNYPNSKRGVEDINFRIERGQILAITGRIGSGKTTLLRAVLGLLPEAQGEIYWNGQLVKDPATFFTPPQAAYTPQVPHLFSDSLKENLLMGWPEDGADLDEALRAAVMESDLGQMPEGLETRIGARGTRLSGGQLLRATAARMFVREPQLLVIDDLSSALDVDTERTLWERFLARPNVTCLIVSHRPAILNQADQVLWLDEGRVVAAGKWLTVLELNPDLQFGN